MCYIRCSKNCNILYTTQGEQETRPYVWCLEGEGVQWDGIVDKIWQTDMLVYIYGILFTLRRGLSGSSKGIYTFILMQAVTLVLFMVYLYVTLH